MTMNIYGLDLWDQIRGIGSMDCLPKQYLHSNHNFSKVKQISLHLLQLTPIAPISVKFHWKLQIALKSIVLNWNVLNAQESLKPKLGGSKGESITSFLYLLNGAKPSGRNPD